MGQRMPRKDVTVRKRDEVIVVDLAGSACLSGENELSVLLTDLIAQGGRRFVLNLAQVPHIDSFGLSGIVRAYSTVVRAGGTLKLLNAHDRVRRLLQVTRLQPIFELYDSEDDAVRSFDA
jgi:anti-sigma B factor antagonist